MKDISSSIEVAGRSRQEQTGFYCAHFLNLYEEGSPEKKNVIIGSMFPEKLTLDVDFFRIQTMSWKLQLARDSKNLKVVLHRDGIGNLKPKGRQI